MPSLRGPIWTAQMASCPSVSSSSRPRETKNTQSCRPCHSWWWREDKYFNVNKYVLYWKCSYLLFSFMTVVVWWWCPILIIKNQLCSLQSFNLRSFSVLHWTIECRTIKCRYIQYTVIIIKHASIHSKSVKVCGVCFSVTKNLRKKCVNLDIKISRQKYVNL